MKRIIFSLIMLFVINSIWGQSKFRNGYIITHRTDTILGLIKNGGRVANASHCIFKKEGSEEKIKYQPDDISGYRFINDKFYISKEITLKGNKISCFLEFLVDGIVDVFCYYNADGVYYFIQKENEEIYELKSSEKTVYRDGVEYSVNNKEYIGYLKYIFSDAPDIEEKVNNLSLNRSSLIDISTDYHNEVCKDYECVVYKKKLSSMRFSLGPLVGINYLTNSQVAIEGNNPPVSIFGNTYSYTNFSYGLIAKLCLPSRYERFEIGYEGYVYSYDQSQEFVDYIELWSTPEDIQMSTSTDFTHNLLFRYKFLKGRLRPFVDVGGFFTHRSKSRLELPDFDYYFFVFDPSESTFGFNVGLGMTYEYYKKNEVFIRLLYGIGTGDTYYKKVSALNVSLGFPITVFQSKSK